MRNSIPPNVVFLPYHTEKNEIAHSYSNNHKTWNDPALKTGQQFHKAHTDERECYKIGVKDGIQTQSKANVCSE